MGKWDSRKRVGLRDKKTHQLIAAYPDPLEGTMEQVSDRVFDWYYQKDCAAEHAMEQFYVDVLNEDELKSMNH